MRYRAVTSSLLLLLLQVGTAHAQIGGLVASYSFEEGSGTETADSTGNGNVGILVGPTWTSKGKSGRALQFDGRHNFVDLSDRSGLEIKGSMSIGAWIYSTGAPPTNDDAVIVSKRDKYGFQLDTTPDTGRRTVGFKLTNTARRDMVRFGVTELLMGRWYHVMGVYDALAKTMDVYLNGELDNGELSGTVSDQQVDSLLNVNIGRRPGNPGEFEFKGIIDEVRVYTRPLTAAEVRTLFNAGSDTSPPTAPKGLTATPVPGTQITLSWIGAEDDTAINRYRVERCPGVSCADFSHVATLSGLRFTDKTGLIATESYKYRVQAIDEAGNVGPYSNEASATTSGRDTAPPTAPRDLTVAAVSGTQTKISWTPATDNIEVTGYLLERCQGVRCRDADFIKIGTPAGTTYADSVGLAVNTTYRYVVRAIDAAGNLGPYSNVAGVMTLSTNPSLVAAYAFNEGAGSRVADSSGHGNHGTISNARWTNAGRYGGALTFNGTDAFVSVPDSPTLRLTTGMTLEAWVNPSPAGLERQDVIYKGNFEERYLLSGSSSGQRVPAGGLSIGGKRAVASGPAGLQPSVWKHLAVTYDGIMVRLYVDAVEVASRAKSGRIGETTNPLQVGGDDEFYGRYFAGTIDEVRIYNQALSPAQIQADMNTAVSDAGLPIVSLNTASIRFQGNLANGRNLVRHATLRNTGSTTLHIASIVVSGFDPSDFTQVNDCAVTLAIAKSCVIEVTFAPQAAGKRNAEITIVSNAVGSPHTVHLTGTGPGLEVKPRAAALTMARTQQFIASDSHVVWRVDGVVGGSSASGTITSGGLYSPPQVAGTHTVTATTVNRSASATAVSYVSSYPGTFTHHNDNARTGQNLHETILSPANVNVARFGKLFSYPLDGIAYASPLYMADLTIPGQGVHNVVFVATEHDSVFAFDADGLSTSPLWRVSFIHPAAGITTVPTLDTGDCCDIAPEIGITGTPVIDPVAKTLYVVAKTKEGASTYVQRLHALDIATGQERTGSPVVIQATVPGSGAGSEKGRVSFNALQENQRAALLLTNGVLYIAFGSHGDNQPYHGWVLGYDAATLRQVMVFNSTPDGEGGGIWHGGGGLSTDDAGNVYFATGDGTFDAKTGGRDYGTSMMVLSPAGKVLSYFTPHDQAALDAANVDLSSSNPLLLPDQDGRHPHLLVSASKNGTVYLVDRDDMGHFKAADDSQIVQSLAHMFPPGGITAGNFSTPVYFTGSVYFSAVDHPVQAFRLSVGLLSVGPTSQSSVSFADRHERDIVGRAETRPRRGRCSSCLLSGGFGSGTV
ncbi:MAG: hypothetical protein DMF90_24625 [Acidobacteria bacterium]|nr:MAG: hypothetical protein DMF90_24625 [Acidobacteriota bacterium]